MSFHSQLAVLRRLQGGGGERDYPFGAGGSEDGFYEGVGSWEESRKMGEVLTSRSRYDKLD